jgi:hypothetical protein
MSHLKTSIHNSIMTGRQAQGNSQYERFNPNLLGTEARCFEVPLYDRWKQNSIAVANKHMSLYLFAYASRLRAQLHLHF